MILVLLVFVLVIQLILGVISTITVLFASSSFIDPSNISNTRETEFGVFCAILGLIALGMSIYYFFRYMAIAIVPQHPNSNQRLDRADAIKVIQGGLIVNLAGMLLTIVGAEVNVGFALAKALYSPLGAFDALDPKRLVSSIDLLVIQANTNLIAAHFVGIISPLLLLKRIIR